VRRDYAIFTKETTQNFPKKVKKVSLILVKISKEKISI
jgi:hypothetical protein